MTEALFYNIFLLIPRI